MSELPPFRFSGYSAYPVADDQPNEPRNQFTFYMPPQEVNNMGPGPVTNGELGPPAAANQVS